MGAWSVSIMGDDTAMDLKEEYKAAFATYSAEEAAAKLDRYCEKTLDDDEIFIYYYSVAQFMWEHGILIPKVKDRAIDWIDNEKGLELFAEAGESTLKKRKLVLQKLKEKLNSPMPSKKKISLVPNTIFELGDMITVQLNNKSLRYLNMLNLGYHNLGSRLDITAGMINKYAGYYVVVKKIYDVDGRQSPVVPEIKNGYPVYVLYDYLDKKLPDEKDIKKMKILDSVDKVDVDTFTRAIRFDTEKDRKRHRRCVPNMEYVFQIFNKTESHWKKRNYQIIGNDLSDCKKVIATIKKSMKYMEKWEPERIRDFDSPFTVLGIDFEPFILRRFLWKGIIKYIY